MTSDAEFTWLPQCLQQAIPERRFWNETWNMKSWTSYLKMRENVKREASIAQHSTAIVRYCMLFWQYLRISHIFIHFLTKSDCGNWTSRCEWSSTKTQEKVGPNTQAANQGKLAAGNWYPMRNCSHCLRLTTPTRCISAGISSEGICCDKIKMKNKDQSNDINGWWMVKEHLMCFPASLPSGLYRNCCCRKGSIEQHGCDCFRRSVLLVENVKHGLRFWDQELRGKSAKFQVLKHPLKKSCDHKWSSTSFKGMPRIQLVFLTHSPRASSVKAAGWEQKH